MKTTGIEPRNGLQSTIRNIAGETSDAVGGWDLKQFVLRIPFCRFTGENPTRQIEGGDYGVYHADMPDDAIVIETKDDATKATRHLIYPGQPFVDTTKSANTPSVKQMERRRLLMPMKRCSSKKESATMSCRWAQSKSHRHIRCEKASGTSFRIGGKQ